MLHHIDLSNLERIPVRVARTELPSTIALVADVLGERATGAPERWRRRIRSVLDRHDAKVFGPLVDPLATLLPDCLLPLPAGGCSTLDDELEAIASTSRDVLEAQLSSDIGRCLPPHWRAVKRRSPRWLHAYARSLRRAASALTPAWVAADGLLDREIERLGTAAVTGALRELLTTLHPLGAVRGDRFSLPRRGPHDGHWTLSPQGLVLTPMLGGPGSVLVRRDGSVVTHIGYPLPGAVRMRDRHAAGPTSLDALLGVPRARLLRALDRPAKAGSLARVLQAAPSAATHHIGVLESAGLVDRRRDGQHVVVTRTLRGTAILGLYGG